MAVGGHHDPGTPAASVGEDRTAPVVRGVLRPRLTAPTVVPMTEEQRQQSVAVLSAMIVDWWRCQAREAAAKRPDDGV
jgi:hypothetical protein